MGIHNLTNVPTKASGLDVRGMVTGLQLMIVCVKPNAGPGDYLLMTSTHIGEHMFGSPGALLKMYADDLATVIRMARDAGYEQAKADIRAVLGVDAGSFVKR